MAITPFYSGTNDINLAQEMIAKKPDVYIQKYEYIGEGVLSLSVPAAATLTPATSPSWTVDAYNSTVARNLLIVDNNGKVGSAKVADTTATAITFDSTDVDLEEDEGTNASFTTAQTYQFYVLTPSSISGQPYGPFMGYAEGLELSVTQTFKTFQYGQPKKKIRRDIDMVEGSVKGGTVNWTNEDILTAVLNATKYGKNTAGYTSYTIGTGGTCNAQGTYYRITFVNTDVNCRTVYVICRKVQFNLDGNLLAESADGYSMANFNAELLSDGFYPASADMIQVKRVG
jgi:hypothetical protein